MLMRAAPELYLWKVFPIYSNSIIYTDRFACDFGRFAGIDFHAGVVYSPSIRCPSRDRQHTGRERLDVGPFNFPWPTFLAFVVIDVSVVIAVVWAVLDIRRERQGEA